MKIIIFGLGYTNLLYFQLISFIIYIRTPYCYHGTIDQKEVNKFSELCDNWWNESGDLKALHTLNQLRVPLIRDGLAGSNVRETATPLSGLHILDVGCGGGILTEVSFRRNGDKYTM